MIRRASLMAPLAFGLLSACQETKSNFANYDPQKPDTVTVSCPAGTDYGQFSENSNQEKISCTIKGGPELFSVVFSSELTARRGPNLDDPKAAEVRVVGTLPIEVTTNLDVKQGAFPGFHSGFHRMGSAYSTYAVMSDATEDFSPIYNGPNDVTLRLTIKGILPAPRQ